jgi:tetratricopeptide (TPR) repeat protein
LRNVILRKEVYSRLVVSVAAIRACVFALLVIPILWPAMAAAQQAPPDSAARTRALELFHQSAEEYRTGHFADAADLLTEAYALFPEPVLLLNLARALEGLEDLSGALDAYERYLDASPNARDRVVVERRMSLLRNALEERRAREALEVRLREQRESNERDAEAATEAEPAEETGHGPMPWILTGTGGAVLVAGIVTGVVARDRHVAAQDEPVHAVAADLAHQADRLGASTTALLVIGGVAAAAGVTWGIVRAARGRDDSSSPRVEVGIGLGTVAIRGVIPGS